MARINLKGMTTMTMCIDLKARFGREYRIGLDPAAKSEADPWMFTLPGRRGFIYPHGGEALAVEVDGRPILAKRVAAIPGVVLHQGGDREMTFLFPVALFDRVAELVQPRRRRRLSPEQRETNRTRLARYRFSPARQSSGTTLEPPKSAVDGV
jgi:hypothetical protein